MGTYRIDVLGGDGIGPEVTKEAPKVLDTAENVVSGLHFHCEEPPTGAGCYLETGSDLPPETLEACKQADAVLFGAAGLPNVRFPD